MIRLLGQTATVQGGHAEKKRFLMQGLCRLVVADSWVWTLSCQNVPGKSQVYASFLHDGFSEERYSTFLKALEHPDMTKVAERFFQEIATQKKPLTMQRRDIDPEGIAYQSPVGKLWEQIDVGPLIMSCHPLDESSASGIGIYRRKCEQDFSEREIKIAHLILSEVPWLHMSGWPEDRGVSVPELTPRQRTVLNLLLDGWSRKQIAAHLDITLNTVQGYAKELYRHFGVNSHPKLMRRFFQGS